VSIALSIAEPADEIELHALGLAFTSLSLTASGEEGTSSISRYTVDLKRQTIVLHLDQTLQPGTATLQLGFTGDMTDSLCGLYRSSYTINGEQRFMAVTQFEATDARRCFPCWDEPAVKASFQCTLVVPADRVAVSNTDIISKTTLASGRCTSGCAGFGIQQGCGDGALTAASILPTFQAS